MTKAFSDDEAQIWSRERSALHDLFVALIGGEMEVQPHFQPIADLHEGNVAGYEALCRFPPAFGLRPDVCFAQARSLGLGTAVEDVVFRQTLRARRKLPRNSFLSVNVGPAYLLSQEMGYSLEKEGDLTGLVFEITEETPIGEYEAVRHRLRAIRQMGALIAVDDAGAGYASLSHIIEVKPELIKIDRRIVQNCHTDRAKSTLIEMLGAAANRMDAWILAEGVECAGELEELLLLGVPLVQGYFLGYPTPGMTSLSEAALKTIALRRSLPSAARGLEGIFSGLKSCTDTRSAVDALHESGAGSVAVVPDTWGRPAEVWQHHPLLGVRQLPTFLRVQVGSDPGEILQRAMMRSAELRFDPLIVIAPEGDLLGFLEVDRLLRTLLGSSFQAA